MVRYTVPVVNIQKVGDSMEQSPKYHPNRMVASFHGDTQTQMGFNWFTREKASNARVWLSQSPKMTDTFSFKAESEIVHSTYVEFDENGEPLIDSFEIKETYENEKWNSLGPRAFRSRKIKEVRYTALAKDLEPAITYYYQVGAEGYEKSRVGTFKTSSPSSAPFTFIQYTDTQTSFFNKYGINEARYAANTLELALKEAPDSAFILHNGDIVEDGEVEDEWLAILEASAPSLRQAPFVPVAGNHDEYSLNMDGLDIEVFNRHFNIPVTNDAINGGSYYSFDYNQAHFTVLNTNDYKNREDNQRFKMLSNEQIEWMIQDIQTAREMGAKWIILVQHLSLFSRTNASMHEESLFKLIDELEIDLVLQGHDHVHARTKPLRYDVQYFKHAVVSDSPDEADAHIYRNPKGTIFTITNAAGTKLSDDLFRREKSHVHRIRPDLSWVNTAQLAYYNSLFAFTNQPLKTRVFENSIANERDSILQSFNVYEITDTRLTVKSYDVVGELSDTESKRKITLSDTFTIIKEWK